MKANQKSLLANDTRAQVGIGTMIVFIATILVAATAAAVLIDTSGKLQERSSSTGNEATKQVASNLVLVQATGTDTGAGTTLQSLNFTVSLAPGASQVDLEQLKIQMTDGSTVTTFDHGDASVNAGEFTPTFLRDHDNTADVMIRGDLVAIELGTSASVSARDEVSVTFIPEVGSQMDASFTVPSAWSANDVVVLR